MHSLRKATLVLPWTSGQLLRGGNGGTYEPWEKIQHILSGEKFTISSTDTLIQFMEALLIRKGYHESSRSLRFSSLRYAIDKKLSSAEKSLFLTEVIPWMKELVMKGSSVVPDIPLMKQGEDSTVELSRQHIITLLACSFFSLFPFPQQYYHHFWFIENDHRFPAPNMCQLFSHQPTISQVAKVHALLLYFITCYEFHEAYYKQQPLVLSRRHLEKPPDFSASDKPLQPINLTNQLIEEDPNTLQTIFANKLIGGGVLGRGCVQEEIRLVISPELLVALALCEQLGDSEALFCDGVLQFVSYLGYARSFNVVDRIVPSRVDDLPVALSRTAASVVWMDAISFRQMVANSQYSKKYIDRELNKSYISFLGVNNSFKNTERIVSTGNWGCGAFAGDPQLKILLQWCSASEAQRLTRYSVFDQSLEGFEKVKKKLEDEKWTVGKLYNALIGYGTLNSTCKDVMEYTLRL